MISLSETHYLFAIDIVPPPVSDHRKSLNDTIKDCTTTLKEVISIVRATIQKANQTKYLEMNISCLYLIN